LGGKTSPTSFPTAVVAHNIFNESQRKVSEMPFSLLDMGCVYFQKDSDIFIIVAGGLNESVYPIAKTLALDLNTFTWQTLGDLVKPTSGIKLAVMDGTIFAFGGADEKSTGSDLIQKLDWHTKTWTEAGHLMTTRNYPAVTPVPASMFESMKITSKEDLKHIIGAEWVSLANVPEEDKKSVFFDALQFAAESIASKEKLTNIFNSERMKSGRLPKEDLAFLESFHPICRVKVLTHFPGYEIILPGEIDLLSDCQVNFEGKIFTEDRPLFVQILVPGFDVLIWRKVTENKLPRGLVKGGSKKGQTVYICKSSEFHKIGHAYIELGKIWCSISDLQNKSLIGVPNFSLLSVEGDDLDDEVEYGEHPNEFVFGLEEMNEGTILRTWQKEEIQELFRYVEIDQETNTFTIPDGWEVVNVDMDNFDKHRKKFPNEVPKKLSYSFQEIDKYGMDAMMINDDILMEYYYNSLEMGTGRFIQKTKKACKEKEYPALDKSKENYPENDDEFHNENDGTENEFDELKLAKSVEKWNKCN